MYRFLPLVFYLFLLTLAVLYMIWVSFDNEWYITGIALFIGVVLFNFFLYLALRDTHAKYLNLASSVDSGYEIYIDGQKSDIDFDSDFIIDNYSFTIDEENRYISCTPKS